MRPREILVDEAFLRAMPLPQPAQGDGKEGRGRVLVVGGSRDVPGAALLAGTGVLRAGAGKLQIAAPRSIAVPLGLAVPEAMAVGLPETDRGGLAAEALDRVLDLAGRCRALLVGPGLVEDDETASLVRGILEGTDGVPMVLDAAAMMRVREDKAGLARHDGRVILTPHPGELAAMLGRPSDEIEADLAGAARGAAADLGAIVVLKSGCTHVATAAGELWACRHGNVGLATSGSGDTLAGIMAGLLGRGAEPVQAALWSVFLHGEAGNRLARKRGPLGFLARELPDEIPGVLCDLSGEAD